MAMTFEDARGVGFSALDRFSHRLIAGLFAALAVFAITAFMPAVLNDGDTYWHISAGQWMLQQGSVLTTDTFSYTAAGQSWHAQGWLAEILMALAFNAGGWSGLLLLFAMAAGAAAGIFAFHLARWMRGLPLLLTVVLGLTCISASLLARPHLLALPLLALWTAGLVSARADNRAPNFWLLPVMMLWANLHGSFMLGLALVGALGLEATWEMKEARWQAFRGWLLFGVAAALAAMVTPQGWESLVFPFQLTGMAALGHIGEWQSTDFARLQPLEIVILLALFLFATRGVKLPAARLLIVLFLLHMALQHMRHQMIFALVAPLLLAPALGAAFRGEAIGVEWPKRVVASFAVATLLALAVLRLAIPAMRSDDPVSPITALAAVPSELAHQPVLNDYAFGGYLIFNGLKPYIDSRADLYGDAFLKNYAAIIRPDKTALTTVLEKHQIRWTILSAGSPVAMLMDTLPGWRRIHADRIAVVHIR